MRGVVLGDEGSGPVRCEEWSGRWEEWSWQMRGVVLADGRRGPGRREEWSWQMKGVVRADERSGPGR